MKRSSCLPGGLFQGYRFLFHGVDSMTYARWYKFACLVFAVLTVPASINAAVFHVGAGDSGGLLEAIRKANRTNEPNEIILTPSTYTLDQASGSTDGPNGLPTVTGALTIRSGMSSTTDRAIIERRLGRSNFRIFHVSRNAALTLIGITVRNGSTGATGDSALGGGLYNRGRLTIINSLVTQNRADFGAGFVGEGGGGGIFNHSNFGRANSQPGLLVIAGSAITCNVAGFRGGGGILNDGALIVTDSTISLNTTDDVGPIPSVCGTIQLPQHSTGGGAGLMNTGTATLEYNLVSENIGNLTIARTTGGGGIVNSPVPCRGNFLCNGFATMSISNSTISGNLTRGHGGGIENAGNLQLNFVTVTENRAIATPEDAPAGGGIRNNAVDASLPPARLLVTNSIVADNTSLEGENGAVHREECAGDVISEGFNIFPEGGGCRLTMEDHSIETRDVQVGGFQPVQALEPLAENGGLTRTHALLRFLPGGIRNPAVGGADPSNCAPTEQRRLRRLDGSCDVGAYELFAEPPKIPEGRGVIRQNVTLTEDFLGEITIAADGIELNCDGHTIRGPGRGIGIELNWRRGVTVRNCGIEDFSNGIVLEDSANNVFRNINRVRFSTNDGVHIVRSAGNFFDIQNVAENDDDGIDLEGATGNVFKSIRATRNMGNGFIVSLSSLGNLFLSDRAEGSGGRGFRVRRGSSYNSFIQNFSCNNALTDFEENSHPNLFQGNTFCSEFGIREREKF